MAHKHTTKREARRIARARQKLLRRILLIGLLIIASAVVILIIVSSIQTDRTDQSPTTGVSAMPTLIGTKKYSGVPPMLIDIGRNYFATVRLAKGGEFVIQLYPDKAPITVNNFVFLARQGFYNGVTFHRVIDGFMAQSGDPTGTGSGGPGYTFANEANDLKYDKPGVVGMANTGRPNSNGSQFFIMFDKYSLSESNYTIFGQVVEGMDVVNSITRRNPETNPDFTGDVIESITIAED
jgi:cyclophilin family peptidyl-prolyl cis-trans isomerase